MNIITIINCKGGTAKTTSTLNLAAVKAKEGKRVLMIDLDPQASLTIACGIEPGSEEVDGKSICDVLEGKEDILECCFQAEKTGLKNLFIIPSDILLVQTSDDMTTKRNRGVYLKTALSVLYSLFDYCFIDCGPELGVLAENALIAAHEVIIPVTCSYLAYRGYQMVLAFIESIRSGPYAQNRGLLVRGTIATLFEVKIKSQKEVLEYLDENTTLLGVVKKSADAYRNITEGLPVVLSKPECPVAKSYEQLASQICL